MFPTLFVNLIPDIKFLITDTKFSLLGDLKLHSLLFVRTFYFHQKALAKRCISLCLIQDFYLFATRQALNASFADCPGNPFPRSACAQCSCHTAHFSDSGRATGIPLNKGLTISKSVWTTGFEMCQWLISKALHQIHRAVDARFQCEVVDLQNINITWQGPI